MGKYDDIINLPHHVSDYYKPMPLNSRAAQFAPFAALNGHEEAIHETERQTAAFLELAEEEMSIVSSRLKYALAHNSKVVVTHFLPDKTKVGGMYIKEIGRIKKWEESDKKLILSTGKKINIELVSDILILKER